jgi:hypothetical protein
MPTIQRVIKIQHKPTAAAAAAGIITRHHQQLDQQSDQKIPFSSVPGTPAHAPPILEKTCGLFDIDNNPFDTESKMNQKKKKSKQNAIISMAEFINWQSDSLEEEDSNTCSFVTTFIDDNKSDALDMENMSIPLDQLLHLEEPPLTPVKKSFSEKINQVSIAFLFFSFQ